MVHAQQRQRTSYLIYRIFVSVLCFVWHLFAKMVHAQQRRRTSLLIGRIFVLVLCFFLHLFAKMVHAQQRQRASHLIGRIFALVLCFCLASVRKNGTCPAKTTDQPPNWKNICFSPVFFLHLFAKMVHAQQRRRASHLIERIFALVLCFV